VVDVGAGAWDTPIVEHAKGVGCELVEPSPEPFLPDRADVPCGGRLWVVGQGVDQPAELRMSSAEPVLTAPGPALKLASS
jgi:hypothetical protein